MAHPYPWSSAIPAMNAFFPRRSMGSVVLDEDDTAPGDDRDDARRANDRDEERAKGEAARRDDLERRRACADIITYLIGKK